MNRIIEASKDRGYNYGHMTLGECIDVANITDNSVGTVILQEVMDTEDKSYEQVVNDMQEAFAHNMYATQVGLDGESFLLGRVGYDLTKENSKKIIDDDFVNKMVSYTLAAQVGNHTVGLRPCAGTGDSCPYTGFIRAVQENISDQNLVDRVMAVVLKIGGIFRVGKTTTGCNMEGFGAGAAAVAAGFVELEAGTPDQVEKAVVLALSPTLSVPCTPRVMVPGLCATHIGAAILVGRLASHLAMYTSLPSTVPVDVMIATAEQCHLASAEHIVPITIKYMEPFFRHDKRVDLYVDEKAIQQEKERQKTLIEEATLQARALSDRANPITHPFGEAVVGGSSQGVGSPTNCARIAHFLSKGKISKIKIELFTELFARRAINIPGILMGAVEGASTKDAEAYKKIIDKVKKQGIEVEIVEVYEPSVQRVTIYASEGNSMVDSLNRGGARLVLRNAEPSLERAYEIAKELDIVVLDQ
ncbi:MAG: serine dehydratase [Clostridiaceae bacterium]|jgi:L-serine dehydratase|nr:serine dehydratase [Clostridiaceae bacterium]